MNNLWCTNYSSVRTNTRFTVANREDPDQTASDLGLHYLEAVWSGSAVCTVCLGLFGRQLVLKILKQCLLNATNVNAMYASQRTE